MLLDCVFVKPKPKLLQKPIRRYRKYLSEPIRLKVKTSKPPEARDNACDEVVSGFNFASM